MTKLLLTLTMVGLVMNMGCGSDPTGPNGQEIEVQTNTDDNGNISSEFQYYQEGTIAIKHGWYKTYNEDGTLISSQNYYKDELDGKWVEYYSNGQIEIKGNYKDGYKDGKWVEYSNSGNVMREYCYYNSVIQNDMSRCENNSPSSSGGYSSGGYSSGGY